jgi:hypothetical protein
MYGATGEVAWEITTRYVGKWHVFAHRLNVQIPSVISFSKRLGGAENWGSDLSTGALAMINTKLELDLNDISEELDLIQQALVGVDNLNFKYVREARVGREYNWRRPEDIVEKYLTKVFEHLLIQMQSFSDVVRRELRLDLVVTIPAEVRL